MNYGFLSVIPPLVAIVLALLTKEVLTSLLSGIVVGGIIYTGGNILFAFEEIFVLMGKKVGDNGLMIIFLSLLGSLVMVMNMAGGSFAYGKWAKNKIKNRKMAKLATVILGMLIFIDDYFNCLTVGTVMKPITDEHKISRAKLAHIIDSSAAPICIIAPISSWAASIIAIIGDAGIENPVSVFLSTIPLNLYALLTIFTLFYFSFSKYELGKMKEYEVNDTSKITEDTNINYKHSPDGKVFDLIIPIFVLIFGTIFMMIKTGGYFNGEISISQAFGNANVNLSLVISSSFALITAFCMYIPRKLVTFNDFMSGIIEGMKSMLSAIVILILAWTVGGITSSDYLNTGGYIGGLLQNSTIPMWIFPTIIFVVSSFLSFSTGTAWGTFGILIPILIPILAHTNHLSYLTIVLAAVFSGSVFGDHCSPISDTTILSSAAANCNHIIHVSTQLPYAIICAVSSIFGFIVLGITNIWYLGMAVSLFMLIILIRLFRV